MSGTGDRVHVLHVDDEPSLSDMVATFLERENDRITVRTATSADEGQQILSTDSIDCIVSDYDMPGQNGIEFLETVREEYPDLPFILYTGKGSEEVASDAISAGVTDYLQKESGTDQYTILANRITNAVAQIRAVEEVSRTRAYFGTILERASDYVIVVDEHAQVDYISPAVERVLGYQPKELEGTDAFEHVHPADLSTASDAFADLLEHPDQDHTVEYRVRHADGSWRWVEVRGRNRLEDTVIGGIIVSVRDITQRKARQQELREKERRYQAVFNDPNILVGMLDTDGTVLDINETAMRYIEADVEEITGKPFWKTPWFSGDESVQQEIREWIDKAAAGEYVEFEIDLSTSVDEPLVVSGVFRPVRNDDGEVVSLLISDRDITEQKDHEQKRQQIIDRTNDAVIEVDAEWRITLVNGRTEDLAGLDESNLLDRHFWDVFADARGTQFEDEYRRAKETHEPVSFTKYYTGLEEWFDVNVYPNRDGGVSIYFRQVTEYKEREKRLEQYEKIVETIDDVAFVVNDEWIVEFVNESVIEYIDAPLDTLEGQAVMRLAEEYIVEADDPCRFEQALERTFEREGPAGSPERLELTLNFDGEQVTFEYQFSPLVADGETGAAVIMMRDITDRKRQEERFQAFIEHSTDIISVLDPDGTYQYQSPSGERITGYEAEELLGEIAFEYVHPDDRNDVMKSFSESIADPEISRTVEYRFKHKDGSWRWFESAGNNQLANPAIEGFVVNSRDITERKQQMQEIEALKERLEFAVEGANLGVWDWDMTTDEVEFNEQWAEMLGYSLDELDQHLRTWETRVHPDDIDDVEAALDAHIDQQTDFYDTEHRMQTAEGEWKWIRDLGKIVERDDGGDPIRAVGIHLDVNEAKQYQRELEQKTEELKELTTRLEEQYQTLFEEAPVMAVVTRTENGRPVIADCNNQFADTLGYEPAAVIGTELPEFYTPDSREALIDGEGYERSLKGEFTREPCELVTAEGEVVETVLRSVPRKDESGDVVGTMAMYMDITEREEVKRANERLEEFTSIVSHDLRNPLNVASGHLELAREDCESPHLETIERAHGRMETLIVDLLTLAREGEDVTEREPVNIAAVVAECWENVETAEASLTLESERTIVADEPRLKQLFENLIRNAVEHGGSAVAVTVGELTDGFYIEDTGPGISEDDVETVFEVGYSTNVEGSGFGLSIVQQVVKAHNWSIGVTRSSDGGTRFEITGVEFTAE
ncbi:hybrid sensor histidine kinase/response regulator [Halobaculum magnesiiphilum]|uniref:histidine kinase n=1 Tax=Halobaculum magnesiiphilum TaxID=1017351 RepID=A0A8T8WH67_9EURY|nr:PAS domain S-box protein [Halobaculum magnesiiphilum]QZP39185.1 PAS domain S-box protein [Halobaculum magnesiiphilum]